MRRDVNHFLNCPIAKGRSTLDEYLGDMLPIRDPNSYGGGVMPLNPDGSIDMDKWVQGREAKQATKERAEQKSGKSIVEEGRATATPTAFAQPLVAPAPLTRKEVMQQYTGDEIWDARGRTRDTPAGRAWEAASGIGS
jgi:hypothetical protein